MEIFVNRGQIVFSARIFLKGKIPEIIINNPTTDLEVEIREIKTTKKKEEQKL